jgi:aspartate-semialdehyde dehydrogenase
MARPIADRAEGRVAVLGAASPAGAHLKAALAERGIPGARVSLFGLHREIAVLSEYDGEARLVQTANELDAAGYDVVFVCEVGYDAAGLREAASSGTLVVDMTGTAPGAVLTGSPAASPEARVVAVPHPLTTLLVSLLAPIQKAIGLVRVSAHVLRPSSDFGEPGLEELREQTVHLLRFEPTPTSVFGRQLAFWAPRHSRSRSHSRWCPSSSGTRSRHTSTLPAPAAPRRWRPGARRPTSRSPTTPK